MVSARKNAMSWESRVDFRRRTGATRFFPRSSGQKLYTSNATPPHTAKASKPTRRSPRHDCARRIAGARPTCDSDRALPSATAKSSANDATASTAARTTDSCGRPCASRTVSSLRLAVDTPSEDTPTPAAEEEAVAREVFARQPDNPRGAREAVVPPRLPVREDVLAAERRVAVTRHEDATSLAHLERVAPVKIAPARFCRLRMKPTADVAPQSCGKRRRVGSGREHGVGATDVLRGHRELEHLVGALRARSNRQERRDQKTDRGCAEAPHTAQTRGGDGSTLVVGSARAQPQACDVAMSALRPTAPRDERARPDYARRGLRPA